MRGIEKLHPEVRAKAEELQALCRENGLPLLITETLRTKAEQDALYAKGRTAPGKVVTNCQYPYSAHCWGVAFDFCRNVRGREYETADGFFEKVGRLGKSIGLFWGGDFKSFKDMPHFEYPKYVVNNSVKTLIAAWNTPDLFMKSWIEKQPENTAPESNSCADSGGGINSRQYAKDNPADDAWEWAARMGLTDKINRGQPITGETLINLLYKYRELT